MKKGKREATALQESKKSLELAQSLGVICVKLHGTIDFQAVS
jgi:hypothetical protein